MLKSFMFVLLTSICLTAVAQKYTSMDLGKVTTLTRVDVLVTVDSAGTIILSTPTHSIYIDRPVALSFGNTLDAILAGMREIETKDITVVDHRVIGRLTRDGTQDNTLDGIVFLLEFNSTKENKVLLLMYSTHDMEDLLFTSESIAQLDDLVKKALKSVVDYSDQYAYIQSVIEKIDTTAFK